MTKQNFNKKPGFIAKLLGWCVVLFILLLLASPIIAFGMFLQWYFFGS